MPHQRNHEVFTVAWFRISFAIFALIPALACGPPAPSGGGPRVQPAAVAAEPPGPEADAAEWARIVAAAHQEGRVAITAAASSDAREALTEGFQRKYPGIRVDYTGSHGSATVPRLISEREAGQFLLDVLVTGTITQLDLVKIDILDPIASYLVGPEAREPAPWLDGKLDYADKTDRYVPVFANSVMLPLVYNPTLVASGEITSYRDLLNPKWRGKMAMFDPRAAGFGLGFATFLYTNEGLGKEFMRQLFAQNIVFSRDDRQLLDWVVRGQYAIGLATSERMITEFRNKGVPVHALGAEHIREGTYLTAGTSAIGVINRPPHPNATKVYIDYLLSREGQLEWSKGLGYASRRTDVPKDHLPDYATPKPGVSYQQSWKESYVEQKEEIMDFLRATLGS
jgi:iron(III) transport system substrate-binding protein